MSCLKIFKGMVAALLGIGAFRFGAVTSAQGQKKISIGSLNSADQLINSFEDFRARMAELGYRDGQNVGYQYYNFSSNDELLKSLAQKLAPKASQVAMPVDVNSVNLAANAREVAELKVICAAGLEKLAAGVKRKNFDAVFTPIDSLASNRMGAIADVAVTERLSLISLLPDLVKRGARRASLPIEPPRKHQLVLNLKTAKSVDLRVGKELLLRADDVIA